MQTMMKEGFSRHMGGHDFILFSEGARECGGSEWSEHIADLAGDIAGDGFDIIEVAESDDPPGSYYDLTSDESDALVAWARRHAGAKR
jgi:hypothetical protein